MPKPASPVIIGLEEFETFRGGPRIGQNWNDELPCLLVKERDGFSGILCRWELSDADRAAIANGADIMLTLFIGLRGCPPMYLEAFRKDCDAVHILDTRGVITQLPAEVRKYTAEEIAALKRKRESEGSKS
jgi:hypothetical protein